MSECILFIMTLYTNVFVVFFYEQVENHDSLLVLASASRSAPGVYQLLGSLLRSFVALSGSFLNLLSVLALGVLWADLLKQHSLEALRVPQGTPKRRLPRFSLTISETFWRPFFEHFVFFAKKSGPEIGCVFSSIFWSP